MKCKARGAEQPECTYRYMRIASTTQRGNSPGHRIFRSTPVKILVSNDDGYLAPGIIALAEALSTVAEVTVVAPSRNRSATSNSITVDRALRVERADNGYFYVDDGTPADCVHLAVTGLLDFRPDLVVSGINDGSNLGDDTIYSGTVAAAMEGYQIGRAHI